jgi:digeranylgeranylglycerophospholipid reductase
MVRWMKYDVLIVGAGPAGSAAAACSAKAGARTLLVDRKKEIGTPVQCGEVVSASLLAHSGLRLPPGVALCRQSHTRFVLDRQWVLDNRSPYWRGVTVERKIFDKFLAQEAARMGASVQADSRLISMEMDGNIVKGAQIRMRGEDVEVEPKMVVAADGVHSTVGKLMGRPGFDRTDLATGVEFEMVSKRKLPRCMQIFIEPEIGLGYGWIIPKGEWRANVGFGQVGRRLSRRDALLDWIMGHPVVSSYFDDRSILEVKTGDAPVPDFNGGPALGNVLFAGDAAGQTLAFVGEGIMPAYMCGLCAGQAAAEAALNGLPCLDQYDTMVREAVGEEMSMGSDLRDALVLIWTLDGLSGQQRALISGLVMNQVIGEGDMGLIDDIPDERSLWEMVRERVRAQDLPIRLSKVR